MFEYIDKFPAPGAGIAIPAWFGVYRAPWSSPGDSFACPPRDLFWKGCLPSVSKLVNFLRRERVVGIWILLAPLPLAFIKLPRRERVCRYLNIVSPFTSSFYKTSSGEVLLRAVTYIWVAFLEVPATTFFPQHFVCGLPFLPWAEGADSWKFCFWTPPGHQSHGYCYCCCFSFFFSKKKKQKEKDE